MGGSGFRMAKEGHASADNATCKESGSNPWALDLAVVVRIIICEAERLFTSYEAGQPFACIGLSTRICHVITVPLNIPSTTSLRTLFATLYNREV